MHEIAFELVDAVELRRRLRDTLRSPSFKPPTLPIVAQQIFALSQKPNVGTEELGKVLSRDPVIAARVLKIASSPYYGAQAPIRSLRDAIARIGTRGLSDLVMEVAVSGKVFRAKEYAATSEQLRHHSRAIGHLARIVCQYTSVPADFAFLCGLLHDVGLAVSLLVLADGKARPKIEDAWPVLHELHEEAAEIVARAWALPAEVQAVVAGHHAPGGRLHPLAAAILIAHEYAAQFGAGGPFPEQSPVRAASIERSAKELGLNDKMRASIKRDAGRACSQLSKD